MKFSSACLFMPLQFVTFCQGTVQPLLLLLYSDNNIMVINFVRIIEKTKLTFMFKTKPFVLLRLIRFRVHLFLNKPNISIETPNRLKQTR